MKRATLSTDTTTKEISNVMAPKKKQIPTNEEEGENH